MGAGPEVAPATKETLVAFGVGVGRCWGEEGATGAGTGAGEDGWSS